VSLRECDKTEPLCTIQMLVREGFIWQDTCNGSTEKGECEDLVVYCEDKEADWDGLFVQIHVLEAKEFGLAFGRFVDYSPIRNVTLYNMDWSLT
jgi:hypothetical protein